MTSSEGGEVLVQAVDRVMASNAKIAQRADVNEQLNRIIISKRNLVSRLFLTNLALKASQTRL